MKAPGDKPFPHGPACASRDRLDTELAKAESDLVRIEAQRSAASARIVALRNEIAMLDATPPPMASDPASGLAPSTPEGKIKLFRALIRGRPDAYPTRFLSKKTGKPGYARAGSNKLAPGVCGLPKVKCGDCTRQPFNPVDDAAVMVLALRMSEIGEDGIHVTQLKSGGKVAVVIEWTEALRTAVAEAGAIERPVASMHLICNRQGQRYTDSGFKPMWNRLQLAWQEAGGTRFGADLRSPYRETG